MKGEEYEWLQFDPCGDWAVTLESYEVTDFEWIQKKARETYKGISEDVEEGLMDAFTKDKEFERAKAMRDLQCLWASFAPQDDSCQDYEDFM